MPGNLKTTTLQRRLFGQEIQCLMHAFGEVRFCARDVLEMVEDAVRERVRQVALQAADRAVDMAERVGTLPQMVKSRVVVTVPHVTHALRRDPRAIQRLNQSVEAIAQKVPDAAERLKARRARPAEASWELVRELASLPDTTDTREPAHNTASTVWAERLNASQDIFLSCSYRAFLALQRTMTKPQYQDLHSCRQVTFVKQESRSRAPTVRGKARFSLFREWLDLGAKEGVCVPDDALYALGQVAWETVGVVTQNALLHRHFDDIANGCGDPRAAEWNIGRHVLAALGYGIAYAVMVPLTDAQGLALHGELERFNGASLHGAARWRNCSRQSSPCLLPSHIREAMRRMDRAPDAPWGFSPL
jgi:hypothetical protein